MLTSIQRWILLVFSGLNLALVARAIDVEGAIVYNDVCYDFYELKPTTVVLDNGLYSASVWKSGQFVFRDVEPGSYVLNVLSRDFYFDQLRVDVGQIATEEVSTATATDNTPVPTTPTSDSPKIQVRPLPLGTPHNPTPLPPLLAYPIRLTPLKTKVYFEEKQEFSLIGMFQGNPMMLVMVGTVLMSFLMPKMLASMDPDERKELMDRQSKVMGMQSALTDQVDIGASLSKYIGGTQDDDTPVESSATAPKASGGSSSASKRVKQKKR
ncbi:hypothetical protein FRB96_005881 [Tulasnella sp. 330]|nr:hypothetical protein FRB96_005881 [Tulasnella sp. 330]KAG8884567.1 hypothetical protein FRB97_003864 [Tulasnella sp. 331]